MVQFKDYQPLPDGLTGHPQGLEWFCNEHLQGAEELSHLHSKEAIAQLRNAEMKSPSMMPDVRGLAFRQSLPVALISIGVVWWPLSGLALAVKILLSLILLFLPYCLVFAWHSRYWKKRLAKWFE